MIPASVQPASDAAAPFLPYAATAVGFTAAFIVFCWLVVDGIPRFVRSWRDAKHVVNQAEAWCRDEARRVK